MSKRPAEVCSSSLKVSICRRSIATKAGANITDDAPQNKRQDAIDAISPSCALTELGIAGI
jgi:hypothetical protein